MREVLTAPEEIVTGGKCRFGTFNGGIDNINILEAEKPLGYPSPSVWKNFRLKEWEAFQITNDEWFICLAVYNTKSIGTAVMMLYNHREDRLYRHEHMVPRNRLVVASGLGNSKTHYHGRDFSIDITNRLGQGRFDISVSAKDSADGMPGLRADFSAVHDTEPIVIVQPFGKNRPLYSHKALMRCEGSLRINGREPSVFSPESSAVILDDHKGYYPYRMKYDWCTACGFDAGGAPVGFNLTDNQVIDHEKYNENCLWKNGRMYPLPPVSFTRPEGLMGCWQVRDRDGMVDIRVHPLADAPNILNYGIIRLDYHGVFGKVSGRIDTGFEEASFDGFSGMGEKKFIRM